MRNDHKIQLKAIKQQILSFCLRHNIRYTASSRYWTGMYLQWLRNIEINDAVLQEILDEYMIAFENLKPKIERLDGKIEEIARSDKYKDAVHRLECFLGIKTYTTLSIIVEVSDFNCFPSADKFAAFLGLVPGEHYSGEKTAFRYYKSRKHFYKIITS